MTLNKSLLLFNFLLALSACKPSHYNFKIANHDLRIPQEYVIAELVGLRDVPGFDKKDGSIYLQVDYKKIRDASGKEILRGFESPPFTITIIPKTARNFEYIPKTSAQMEKESIENADAIVNVVYNVKDIKEVKNPTLFTRTTLVIDTKNYIHATCRPGWKRPTKVECSNHILDDGLVIGYEVPLEFMKNADRKKALDDFFRNLVRSWKVKA